MALDSSDTAQDKVETRPVLIRASAPSQGVQHEVVARLDLVGGRFARTMVPPRLVTNLAARRRLQPTGRVSMLYAVIVCTWQLCGALWHTQQVHLCLVCSQASSPTDSIAPEAIMCAWL